MSDYKKILSDEVNAFIKENISKWLSDNKEEIVKRAKKKLENQREKSV